MHVGGTVHTVHINTINCVRAPLYSIADMSRLPKRYTRQQPTPASSSSDEKTMQDDHEPIIISRRVLRKICRGRTADSLPPKFRQFTTLEEITMTDPYGTTQPQGIENPTDAHKDNQLVQHNRPNSRVNNLTSNTVEAHEAGQSDKPSGNYVGCKVINTCNGPAKTLSVTPGGMTGEADQGSHSSQHHRRPHKRLHYQQPQLIGGTDHSRKNKALHTDSSGNQRSLGGGSYRRVSKEDKEYSVPNSKQIRILSREKPIKKKAQLHNQFELKKNKGLN